MCLTCSTNLRAGARFCDNCGAPVQHSSLVAEYKQATVLFADVVRSMDLASALDPERLRDIVTTVFNRSAAIVQRYGGTVDKFTGDGIMALFGAPITLEDHGFRACLAALDIQSEMAQLAAETRARDGIDLRLRIGLNSGQIIAGEIDSGPGGYTAIGADVGLAQRMESVAPPGGIAISESTAQLVVDSTILGEPEIVPVKGADGIVTYRLLGAGDPDRHRRRDTTFIGRGWELSALSGVLEQAIAGSGTMVGIVGEPGIGKSRIVSELTDAAARRGAEVFRTYCEAHATDVPFHAVARLLRSAFGITGAEPGPARDRLRARLPDAAPDDLELLADMLGIRDPTAPFPDIDPDARRRRVTELINTASLARTTPTVYVIEDAHWIDEVSDSMLADFIAVVPQTPALVIATYRPEYRGELTRIPRAQSIALAPLNESHTVSLTTELLGTHRSVGALAKRIAEHAAGNPFFAEEIVRDLAERGIITGSRGQYEAAGVSEIVVPSTLHATIAARVDRLGSAAKRTLSAASAIGSRFSADLVSRLVEHTDLPTLVGAELIDQVMFTPRAEYAFRHPLIRTVAYESQLRSTRSDLHRRLATTIENDEPDQIDENAALIAEHLRAAGELRTAYSWHMRAAAWAMFRDLGAAKTSWQRARDIADLLPDDDPNRLSMRIAPRTLLCGSSWRTGGDIAESTFEELRDLAEAAGDKTSLAMGMASRLTTLTFTDRITESADLASDFVTLVESIGQPEVNVALMPAALQAGLKAGAATETLRLARRLIDLTGGDPRMGNLVVGSPLAVILVLAGFAEAMLGQPEFVDTLNAAIETARPVDATCFASAVMYKHCLITLGVVELDDGAVHDAEVALTATERSGDRTAHANGLIAQAIVHFHRGGQYTDAGLTLLSQVRQFGYSIHRSYITLADVHFAMHNLQIGNSDSAIDIARGLIDRLLISGDGIWLGKVTEILVEALLLRGSDTDAEEARGALDRLTAFDIDPAVVLFEVSAQRCRALLARAAGDGAGYRDHVEHYRRAAAEYGYAGHLALADALA
jgi:adenylate cyclase